MQIKIKSKVFFWFVFLSLLSCALIFQTAFGRSEMSHSLMPYLTLPVIIFFFLYHKPLPSICLLLFMSFLSSAFSSLSTPLLFFLYFLYFLIVFLIKKFFFSKSSILFFVLVFIFSLFFPHLFDLAYNFSINDFSFSTNLFYFLKATTTLILSFLLFPVFKKHLQESEGF